MNTHPLSAQRRAAVFLLVSIAMILPVPASADTPVVSSEFIFETAPFPSCHASTIAQTKTGLVAAWFGGTRERDPDVGIWVSRQLDGKWAAPVEVATGIQSDGPRLPCWNPVLFQPKDGPLLLFYKVGPDPRSWWGMLRTSGDEGKSWSDAVRLPEGFLGPIKNKPVALADGSILCPSSTEALRRTPGWQLHFERTTDLGKTWTESAPPIDAAKPINAIQPSVLFHPDGRLQAIGRTKEARVFETWSNDGGKTWSPLALTDLPNPNSGTDAVTLRDGRQLIVYNHNPDPKGRTPLNVAVSNDGKVWQAALVLESEPGEYSYPAVIQAADGMVHITYTWKRRRIKHVVVAPQKLRGQEMKDGAWPASQPAEARGAGGASETVAVAVDPGAAPRVKYGASRLVESLNAAGYQATLTGPAPGASPQRRIVVGLLPTNEALRQLLTSAGVRLEENQPHKEGFVLANCPGGVIAIGGSDDSGVLYGCLELAQRIRDSGRIPADLKVVDAPVMVLRGTCIGMQKPYLLPGRKVYEYPYTPELFPFFYDKAFWRDYLDFLAENRMNTLFLWNGWPFASVVKVADYPYAVEVSPEGFEKNVEMYRFVAQEADKRGIWVVQMFYSIILSKPFAEKNGLETQLSAPTPIAADYTRKSIAEFVRSYPNVGLLVCLGEALQGKENQVKWLSEVILPGVKDGMKLLGTEKEPPVIVRAHATDPEAVMTAALPIYKNLYTMAKFNGESLTTWEPRGPWQQVHLAMGKLGSTHVVNVHILANLEPFRYGDQRFIQKSVQAARDRLGARGVHLYPLAYWDWPNSPDKTDPLLQQWKRDWMWYEAWARYSWNPDRDEAGERTYWVGRLTEMYGSQEAAAKILDAYNDAGECAPRLLRRFGITEGNRQTLSLGMTLDELVDPKKYKAFKDLWESQSPPGERLAEYAANEWEKKPHEGETPPQIIAEALAYSAQAALSIDAAAPLVSKNREEFDRLRNDVHCIREMSQFYAAKASAALLVLRYARSREITDMEKAADLLADSLAHYKTLAEMTDKTYRYANSMQTSQRKIPVPGGASGKPANYHWTQLVSLYETELADFRKKVTDLKSVPPAPAPAAALPDESAIKPLPKATLTLLSKDAETYEVALGAKVFTDREMTLTSVAPELLGLTGIRFSHESAKKGRYVPLEFETTEPVQILVGYFKAKGKGWLAVPNLETDAQAGEFIDTDPAIENAATLSGLPGIDVHIFKYDKGRHKLDVRGTGSFIVLGIVPQSTPIPRRDAGRPAGG